MVVLVVVSNRAVCHPSWHQAYTVAPTVVRKNNNKLSPMMVGKTGIGVPVVFYKSRNVTLYDIALQPGLITKASQ